MDFNNKVAVVTGGAQGIGRCIAEEFQNAGASVCVIDRQQGNHFVGDIADKATLEQFAEEVIEKYGHVDFLINNALPLMKGIDESSYEEFQYALSVGVTAPFYLSKLFMPYFAEGAAIVNISSSRDRMSQPQTESCTLEVPHGTLSAYQAAEQWKEFFFIQEGEASTGISNIVVQPTTDTSTYHTLDGREVKNPGKGIYIVNGKKVLIK